MKLVGKLYVIKNLKTVFKDEAKIVDILFAINAYVDMKMKEEIK